MSKIQCITPVDGGVYVERETTSAEQIRQTLEAAASAQKSWRQVSIADSR